jgi:hypothetical protein
METPRRTQTAAERLVLSAREAELLHTHGTPEVPDAQVCEQRAGAAANEQASDLHLCENCGSDLVHPIDWAPAAPRQWEVQLRCPDCEWRGEGVYNQDTVDRFDEILDVGCQAILDDLTKLTHANMSEDIDRFVAALEKDLVLPEDF